jgi:hypothetical protein
LLSFRRQEMEPRKSPSKISDQQISFLFDASRLEGLSSLDRDKVISLLAQILMQAAGLRVEELGDDER